MDLNLYTAAKENKVEVLKQYPPDQLALQVTPNGNTVLHVAAEFDSSGCVNYILSKCDPFLLCRVNADGNTPIHVASARNNGRAVSSLIATPVGSGSTRVAAVSDMLRVRNRDGDTPLHVATRYDRGFGVVSYKLIDIDTDFGPNKAEETPLYLMVEWGNDMFDLNKMLRNCTRQEYGGPGGRTALHAAVTRPISVTGSYRDEMLDALIKWKKELIKEPDAFGRTPLHYAAASGDIGAINKLLDEDKSVAYITADKDEGNSALHVATAKGELDVMKELLLRCPDSWEMQNSKGRNILHISADLERDDEAITKYISEQSWASSLVNRKDHDGNTPIHVLARKSKQKLFEWFSKADRQALNNEGLTPDDILRPQILRQERLRQRK